MSPPKKTLSASRPSEPEAPARTPQRAGVDGVDGDRDALAAIARSQNGQLSAESFWKTAGRFTKLR